MDLKALTENIPGVVVAVIATVILGGSAVIGGGIIAGLLEGDRAPAVRIVERQIPSEPAQEPEAAQQRDTGAVQQSDRQAPEAPSAAAPAADPGEAVEAEEYMVAVAHPAAAQAGAAMLEAGGTAIDALIAAQMVLNLVEPQSSGIGGGGFMLHWEEAKRRLITYDGRETAPEEIEPDSFLNPDGTTKPFMDAVIGGKSVGVPGLLRMLELAHQRHGKLVWAELFEPAISLAENGFPVSPRLHSLLSSAPGLSQVEPAASYFYRADGTPKPVGTILTNPDFADTLRQIASGGADAFYSGAIAEDIVAAVQHAPANPGRMKLSDLSAYRAIERKNLCGTYRDYLVCGMPPPSSGGLAVLQTLGMLRYFDLSDANPLSSDTIALVSEASALAFADRNAYVADSDFVTVPMRGMLDNDYLFARSEQIDLSDREKQRKMPGDPQGRSRAGLDNSLELPSTSHLSIIDPFGNAVSMTSSIETGFGSRLMVRGFLLNNQLTDFAWVAERDGLPVANRIEPFKRPRSSMSPTIVFDEDRELAFLTGSPGGSRIIGYTLQSIINRIDFGMDPQQAVSAPHFVNRNGPIDLEEGRGLEPIATALEARGYEVNIRPLTSGLHMVEIDEDGDLLGGADPRREGAAVGEDQYLPDLMNSFDFIGAGAGN